MNVFDEVTYRAPGRIALRVAALRIRLVPAIAAGSRVWRSAMPWLTGAGAILGYLLVCSWIQREDLVLELQEARRVNAQLAQDKVLLEGQVAELVAVRTRKLIYLIEADSTAEAKDKLSRLALMVATEHFNLQEATRETAKK